MQVTGSEELAGADTMEARDLTPTHPLQPPSFPHIPIEVLAQIASHLDLPSSIAFARVGRRFAPLTTSKIWSNLDLFLPVYYGRRVNSWESVDHDPRPPLFDDELLEAEFRHRDQIEKKVNAIYDLGSEDADRWKSVKRIKMVPRPGVIYDMMCILQCAAASVEELAVEGPKVDRQEKRWQGWLWTFQELDHNLWNRLRKLRLPVLNHLRIGPASLTYPVSILILCAMAPNLESLDADRNDLNHPMEFNNYDDEFEGWVYLALKAYDRAYSLTRIRFLCNDEKECDTGDYQVLSALISRSPCLRQLYVGHRLNEENGSRIEGMLKAAAGVLGLRELHLQMTMEDFNSYVEKAGFGGVSFARVSKLSLAYDGALDILGHLPRLEGLETLYLVQLAPMAEEPLLRTQSSYAGYPCPSLIPTPLPSFVDKLRSTPKIHTIRLIPESFDLSDISLFVRLRDTDDLGEGIIGRITSLRHYTHELLHIRLLLPFAEVADILQDCDTYDDGRYTAISYTTADGIARQKVFAPLEDPRWSEYCEYDGVAVPLGVMGQMRAEEGLIGDEARGVEVGEAAWAVLTDWMAAREEQI